MISTVYSHADMINGGYIIERIILLIFMLNNQPISVVLPPPIDGVQRRSQPLFVRSIRL